MRRHQPSHTKISYNPLYNEGSLVVFNELEAMKQATKNNAFDFFAKQSKP